MQILEGEMFSVLPKKYCVPQQQALIERGGVRRVTSMFPRHQLLYRARRILCRFFSYPLQHFLTCIIHVPAPFAFVHL